MRNIINVNSLYNLEFVFQLTCDAEYRVTDVVARWPGSTHDARIFRTSGLKARFQRGKFYHHSLPRLELCSAGIKFMKSI